MVRCVLAVCVVLATAATDDLLADLRDRDPALRLAAVESLREEPGETVSRALVRAVGDRDEGVREAAIEALGARADPTSVKALRKALRTFAKQPGVLPRVVIALGAAGDADSAGEVVKLARKALGADPRLADASIDALGSLRSPKAIAGLIELLGTAEPIRGGAAARTGHARHVSGIRQSLREVTGLPFRETVTWQKWWRHARRGWRASPLDPAEVEGNERRDDAWRFRIERADPARWAFTQPKGAALRVRFTGPREEATVAWMDVMAHAMREREPRTLEDALRSSADRIRAGLSDVKEVRLAESAGLGSEPARVHSLTGMTDRGRVTRRRTFVLERHGFLYVLEVHVSSGVSPAVDAEIDAMLESFRLL